MSTATIKQRRLFKIRPVSRWMRYQYPIAKTDSGELPLAAAPLYETRATYKTNPTCQQWIEDWIKSFCVLRGGENRTAKRRDYETIIKSRAAIEARLAKMYNQQNA
jgi:hypothetical protein